MDMDYVVELARAFDTDVKNHSVDDPSVVFEDSNPLCGDRFKVTLRLNSEGGIEDIGFTGRGCAISRAAAYLLAEEIKGGSLDHLKGITREQLIDEMGIEINSTVRLKCASLALRTVKSGLAKAGHSINAESEEDWHEG
jgi:nitrogen fixation NifU-like protein